MKNSLLILIFIFVHLLGSAQKLGQVSFLEASNFAWFSLATDQNILIRISDDGHILEYGTEQASVYNRNYIAQKLLPYQGVVNYYDDKADSAFKGKIKNIGTCYFTYYPSSDYPDRAGKIKSAGRLYFDYYRQLEDTLTGGRIKNIGFDLITYYTSFDNEALKGKLKSVGNTVIQYYTSFDDVYLKGKLKSIGTYRYDWMKTFSGRDFFVTLKTGFQRQLINGVIYVPKY